MNLLASKILHILVNNYSLNKKLDALLDDAEFNKKLGNISIDLEALFKQDEIISLISEVRAAAAANAITKQQTASSSKATSAAELKKSISLVSSSSSSLKNDKSRRSQPRTNPNYINVELLDNKNGVCSIKNTYVKLDELTGKSNGEGELLGDFGKYTNGLNKLTGGAHSLSSLNSSYLNDLSHATVLLIGLLSKAANENMVINKENISASSISWSNFSSPNSHSVDTCDRKFSQGMEI